MMVQNYYFHQCLQCFRLHANHSTCFALIQFAHQFENAQPLQMAAGHCLAKTGQVKLGRYFSLVKISELNGAIPAAKNPF